MASGGVACAADVASTPVSATRAASVRWIRGMADPESCAGNYQLAAGFAIAFAPRPMSVRIVTSVSETRAACDAARAHGARVGFVPTMGALHAGHLALVEEARRRAGFVVASIFVNPTQFGPHEDLARYPRDLDGDVRKLASVGADVAFAPDRPSMYPGGDETRVRLGPLADSLEGAFRPGHFDGVATVVAKLFSVVGPCVAIFGRKDYQQLLVVGRMVRDLLLPVEVVGHPIVREPDGLAMSTRNQYLSPEERARALCIVRGLDAGARGFAKGERGARNIERIARDPIERQASSIDYVEARDADSLAAIEGEIVGRAVLAVACRIGSTRLIDNVVLGEDPPPLG
jgi:pantoate--beta-alanine ligase